jgi:stage V sporulation protein S
MSKPIVELKVSAKSNPASVAGSIAKNIQERNKVEIIAIGAGAINQMNKAVAIASGYVAPNGISLAVKIAWTNIHIAGDEDSKSAIKHIVVEL